MNFATLQGLTIPEGAVTQIADASGRVLWKLETSKPVVLEVEKITSDTYAGETTYTGEQFVLLDIYPKTNGTVKVTYGGLTKTITDTSGAEEPNAQQVFFGTFNGVSDSVATPASGELTIKGDFTAFGVGQYSTSADVKGAVKYAANITSVVDWGEVTFIPANAFHDCTSLALTALPSHVTNIGSYAFYNCTSLALTALPIGITSIETNTFNGCTSLALTSLPNGITVVDSSAFNGCTKLALGDLSNTKLATIGTRAFENCSSMANVILPATVTFLGKNSLRCKLGKRTFDDGSVSSDSDYTVTNVRMLGSTPPTMEEPSSADNGYVTAFAPTDSQMAGTITVPKGSGQTYKTADRWKYLEKRIVEAT